LDFLLTNAEESVKINFAVTQGAGVAQLAEQLICNQQVGGSIPFTSSILYFITSSYGGVPEWPKGADCKSVVVDFGGSNPPSSTIISTIVERTNPHSITSGDLFSLFELSRGSRGSCSFCPYPYVEWFHNKRSHGTLSCKRLAEFRESLLIKFI
jgi:hypothetical protein